MRLIDADALTILLHDDIDGLDEEFPNDKQVKPYMCGVRMALSFIDTAPTIEPKRGEWIDAVPVVRCKDCRHWTEWANNTGSCSRFALDWIGTDADDFCSMAERKDDE